MPSAPDASLPLPHVTVVVPRGVHLGVFLQDGRARRLSLKGSGGRAMARQPSAGVPGAAAGNVAA